MAEATLPEQIANTLRRNILRGELAPGDSIKERDNAAELGVSRTPMREAIRILAKEGLVILRPSRSPIVAKPTLKEVADSIDVLSALEMLSAQRACEHATDAELAEIKTLEQRLADEFETLEDVERFELDMDFHKAIARASHNPALTETHGAFLSRLWQARFLSSQKKRSRTRVLRQHAGIVAALERRDPEAAKHELSAHLEHLIINVHDYFDAEEKETHPDKVSV